MSRVEAVRGAWAQVSHAYERMGATRVSKSLAVTLGVLRRSSAHRWLREKSARWPAMSRWMGASRTPLLQWKVTPR